MSWRAVATVLAAVALTGGCGGGSGPDGSEAGEAGPSAPKQARPVITPDTPIVPDDADEAGDLPDPTMQVGMDCQKVFQKQDFAGPAAQKINQVAADPRSSDSEKAVANACGAVINANTGNWDKSVEQADVANNLRAKIPEQLRRPMFAMLDQAELESAAARGERDRVRRVIARIEREGGQVPAGYLKNACAVVSGTETLPECATITASPGPPQPSSGTSSEPSSGPSQPSEPAGPSPGEPSSEAPGTEPPGEPPDTGGQTGAPGDNPEPPPEETGPAPGPS
ncbi:hypothetical protein ACIBK9_10400 [Nonomuraea sp. NPDC050227]|uniref:hypothetical protein n=1 Tax=Nonomuraea sp. NPDC050227 TaxID=3364360 RepID=UPI00378DDDD6